MMENGSDSAEAQPANKDSCIKRHPLSVTPLSYHQNTTTSYMKYALSLLLICFAFLVTVPVAHAEELQDFLKRTGIGNATTNDVHENFHISVFVAGQAYQMNRD
jgi:hypothetical protein